MSITTSYHRGSSGLPMINVKHHFWWDDICNRYCGKDKPHDFSADEDFWNWAEAVRNDGDLDDALIFEAADHWARSDGWEQAQTDAHDIFGPGVSVYSEGRSGGWLIVEGLGYPEAWDDDTLALWNQYEGYVKAILDELDYNFVWLLHVNGYEPIRDERDDTLKRENIIAELTKQVEDIIERVVYHEMGETLTDPMADTIKRYFDYVSPFSREAWWVTKHFVNIVDEWMEQQ